MLHALKRLPPNFWLCHRDHSHLKTVAFSIISVADLEEVAWVPWNPPFEGQPSRMLSKSAQT